MAANPISKVGYRWWSLIGAEYSTGVLTLCLCILTASCYGKRINQNGMETGRKGEREIFELASSSAAAILFLLKL
ncbi:conserved hypothetical protein [Ricinus communis]|uniref:Uncharacterized protein n=1 Tax=Ricinus communis TaxID=3988 RepID=B9T1Z4_RICCO|nr:conserved hypothetical protein [Ricinus communis]